MRNIVQIASRRPGTGRWQIVLIEDADRLTEGAANALLKVVEDRAVDGVPAVRTRRWTPRTSRSRCARAAACGLVTPPVEAIARVLIETDGLPEEDARWAASSAGGHVGRARRLAIDEQRAGATPARPWPGARRGDSVAAYARGEELVATAEAESAGVDRGPQRGETEELRTALGAGGTGKGTAGTLRGATVRSKTLSTAEVAPYAKHRATALDRALKSIWRHTFAMPCWCPRFRGERARSGEPSRHDGSGRRDGRTRVAREAAALHRGRVECREALAVNVKPKFAVDALVATVGQALRA